LAGIDDRPFADLRDWRRNQGLPPQTDIATILLFPIQSVLRACGPKALVFTTANPDPEQVAEIESQAGKLIITGSKLVDRALLVQNLSSMGYQTVYLVAGPKIFHKLLSGGVLDRIYLTQASR
jgi:riboflavin biosynthesis pyrimidine reductase